eukprot:671050-Alexandrium_andersonii.AAC.1
MALVELRQVHAREPCDQVIHLHGWNCAAGQATMRCVVAQLQRVGKQGWQGRKGCLEKLLLACILLRRELLGHGKGHPARSQHIGQRLPRKQHPVGAGASCPHLQHTLQLSGTECMQVCQVAPDGPGTEALHQVLQVRWAHWQRRII